ncbi:MAG: glycosyltransferase family 2 protein [Streptomycetaceae bacterium]|nr:glycosyltransferase family 2 protein [Streptomycetaceae bacterium]
MSRIAVSVIVPTRNRPALLAHALASIAAQDLGRARVEVIVVNDGGVDVAATVAAARVHVPVRLLTTKHQGLPAARNAALEAARGAFVAYLDDDDVWLDGHLAAALDVLDSGGCDLVHTACLVAHARYDPAAGGPVPARHAFDYVFDPRLLAVANCMPVGAVVMRSPGRWGPRFDTRLAVQEDWEYWLRLTRHHRWRVHSLPVATAIYHRVTDHESMTTSAATTLTGLRRFAAGHRLIHRRWPVPTGGRIHQLRGLPHLMYELVAERIRVGEPVDPCYYEKSLRVIADAVHGRLEVHQAPDALTAAIAPTSILMNREALL